MKQYLIVFLILLVDFVCLGEDIVKVLVVGVDVVYFDVMDNYYVLNLMIGLMVLKLLCNYGIIVLIDVYLMVKLVDCIIFDFVEVGVSIIIFYLEVFEYVDCSLQFIKEYGCKVGLVFNLVMLLSYFDYVMDKLDVILLMLVNLGFGGQFFIFQMLDKLCEVCQCIDVFGYDICFEVDGGVKVSNIGEIVVVGVDMFVVGLVIFGQLDYK